MKILVVSGFLGAGKTTFIKELSKRTGKEFVILENEYGEVGVDGNLFEENKDSIINIWELTEGCVCCSTQADLASSIITISNTIDPEYLVVEPTGVGQLSRIINNIKKLEYERIQILSPLTIIDGRMYERHIKNYQEIYEDQIKSATTILFSHFEGSDEDEKEELSRKVRAYNRDATIIAKHYTKQEASWWNSLLERALDGSIIESNTVNLNELENLGLTNIRLKSEFELITFLELLIRGVYGEIVRAKGYINVGANWLKFDVMDTTYAITGIEVQEDTRGVFIGKKLKRNLIRKDLQRHMILANKRVIRKQERVLKTS